MIIPADFLNQVYRTYGRFVCERKVWICCTRFAVLFWRLFRKDRGFLEIIGGAIIGKSDNLMDSSVMATSNQTPLYICRGCMLYSWLFRVPQGSCLVLYFRSHLVPSLSQSVNVAMIKAVPKPTKAYLCLGFYLFFFSSGWSLSCWMMACVCMQFHEQKACDSIVRGRLLLLPL